MSEVHIGIDPGKSGGVAILDESGSVLGACPMPVVSGRKVEYDIPRLVDKIRRQGPEARLWIESLRLYPPKMGGAAANWQRGFCMGLLQGICASLRLPYVLVSPSRWQKFFWKGKADTKQQSILIAERLFPDVDLLPTARSRVPHDGMADALLIAEFGRRFHQGLLT